MTHVRALSACDTAGMKIPSVPLTPTMIAALANLRRATLALREKGGGASPRQLVAHREEDSGLRRAMNDPPEGGGYGRKKHAE